MNRWISQLFGAVVDAATTPVVGPRPQVIGPSPSVTVTPPPRFAWDEKRWHTREANGQTELVGSYRVFDRRRRAWREFEGRLALKGRDISAYIADPPPELKAHRHGSCLQLVTAPWFRLHWSTHPKNLDDALLYMERMLDEAINQSR